MNEKLEEMIESHSKTTKRLGKRDDDLLSKLKAHRDKIEASLAKLKKEAGDKIKTIERKAKQETIAAQMHV